MVRNCVSFGVSSDSTAICQASSFASAVGRAARAWAARSCPVMVVSRVSSSSISSASIRPSRASATISVQRRSVSTTSPVGRSVPSSQPASRSAPAAEKTPAM